MDVFLFQATVFLLDNLDIILAKATEEEVRSSVLPMIFSTLESNSIQGHEAAIGVFSIIRKYMDDQTIRKLVLPKAKALFSKSNNVRVSLRVGQGKRLEQVQRCSGKEN